MFGTLFKFSLLKALKNRTNLFWALAFPVILGTLFKVSFGDYMDKKEIMHQIPMAYVIEEETEATKMFVSLLEEMTEKENPLVLPLKADMEEAEQMLLDEEIKGIYMYEKEWQLIINDKGIQQDILSVILEEYLKIESVLTRIALQNPEGVTDAVNSLEAEVRFIKEDAYTNGSMDYILSYFYALIAMQALYGCFAGFSCAMEMKANLSALAIRRMVAGTKRSLIILVDLLVNLFLHFVIGMIGFLYLKYALRVEVGEQTFQILLVILMGSLIGIATGFFVGACSQKSENFKLGCIIGVTMTECFLAGLMVEGMYQKVQTICPLLNRINPAAVITDALYSLNIYGTSERYIQNLLCLFIIAIVLCAGGFLSIRRERYASV